MLFPPETFINGYFKRKQQIILKNKTKLDHDVKYIKVKEPDTTQFMVSEDTNAAQCGTPLRGPPDRRAKGLSKIGALGSLSIISRSQNVHNFTQYIKNLFSFLSQNIMFSASTKAQLFQQKAIYTSLTDTHLNHKTLCIKSTLIKWLRKPIQSFSRNQRIQLFQTMVGINVFKRSGSVH